MGDPTETTTVPRHACGDAVVAAHGAATKATVEAELARVEWEMRAGGDKTVGLVDTAVLRLRLFDINGAYEALQRACAVGSQDRRLSLLTRYSAQLKAPRDADFLEGVELAAGGRAASLLGQVRDVFLKNQFETKMVLSATKASSMSEFIFVESRADQLERGLLESIEEPNPMKPELPGPKVPTDLVDLVRIFLLHRLLPLARLSQLFGRECLRLLLQLRLVTAIEGDACRIVSPAEAMEAVSADEVGCGAFFVVSNVAIWPLEEDLLIATDFEQTFSSDDLEPVMYLSEDSLALVCSAPRQPVSSVLDTCCGSGVQGIVALRHYAERATFVDLNPRALRFVRLNLALNGLAGRTEGVHEGNLYTALPSSSSFEAILANPPFVPNPQNIASGAGAMFGNGGDTGEDVFAAIVRGAPRLLKPGGRLSVVAMTPNVEQLPERMKRWYGPGGFEALIFRGQPTPAQQYLPTSSSVETYRYQSALEQLGVETLSEVVTVLVAGGQGASVTLAGDARNNLWSDHVFLKMVVQRAAFSERPPAAVAPPKPPAAVRREDTPKREGNLPGFQNGFFPAYCAEPLAEWTAVAEQLEEITQRGPPMQTW